MKKIILLILAFSAIALASIDTEDQRRSMIRIYETPTGSPLTVSGRFAYLGLPSIDADDSQPFPEDEDIEGDRGGRERKRYTEGGRY